MTQRVAIAGASGLIGGALSSYLTERGDEVYHLVRREARTAAEIPWDPKSHTLDPARLDGMDAVAHFAGARVNGKRWTHSYKHEIFASRVDTTYTLATALAAADAPIRFVCGSAAGFYGTRGDEVLTEKSSSGEGFMPEVVRGWEAAAEQARTAGLSVAFARTGILMSPKGGAMPPLIRATLLGAGGPLGTGQEWWPWITLRDHVRAIAHLIDHPEIEGPVNLVGPEPARQRDVAAELGRRLHRPTFLPTPSIAIRIAVGQVAGEVLASMRLQPTVLQKSGFEYEHQTLPEAISWVLAER